MKKILLIFALLGFINSLYSQTDTTDVNVENCIIRKVQKLPSAVSNYSYLVLYLSDGGVYNLNTSISDKHTKVNQVTVQPGGAACAALTISVKKSERHFSWLQQLKSENTKSWIDILSCKEKNRRIGRIDEDVNMTTLIYAPDGRSLAVGFVDNNVNVYDAKTFSYRYQISTGLCPMSIALSANNYFAAISDGERVEVWNLQTKTLRKTITGTSTITSLSFSPNNSMMVVSTSDGRVEVFETGDFSSRYKLEGMGKALSANFHPDNKYLSIAVDSNNIVLQNLYNMSDKITVNSVNSGNGKHSYIQDYIDKDLIYILYSTNSKEIVFHKLSGLQPNNANMLSLRVGSKMTDWMKMRDGESLEEYQLRVNDDTRTAQRLAFEHEIATEMAGDILSGNTISLGSYNTTKNLLTIDFEGLNSIALEVPQSDIAAFDDPAVLKFSNTVYGINDKDEFDVIYTEVYNPQTDKKYIYDNLDRKSSVALAIDDSYVPLQLIQQSSMEEMRLKDIRKQVVEEAKSENLISDNTQINVSTEIVTGKDASGKSIMNYKVNYSYQVEQEFTAKEDFKPGQYKTEESHAAMSMLKIIEKAFSSDFAQYIKKDKRLKIKITGSADAAPIRRPLPYDNCYGAFSNELVYQNGLLNNVTVNKSTGVSKNEELAFLRAVGLANTIEKMIHISDAMICEHEYHIELSDKTGGEYRRINVEFLFEDAF